MIDYIGKTFDDIRKDVKGESATPDTHHLFDIAENATKLSQANANLLHNFVAQLLYLLKRACSVIYKEVSFLWNRVIGPGTDEYNNLDRVMN